MHGHQSNIVKRERRQSDSENEIQMPTTRTLQMLDTKDQIIQYVTDLPTASPIMISVIDQESIMFGHNWLCNVQDFNVYDKVILLATDILDASFYKRWPSVQVFNIQDRLKLTNNSRGLQIDIDRTVSRIVKSILHMNHSVLMFSIKSVWFQDAATLIHHSVEKYNLKDVVTSFLDEKSKIFDFYFTYFKSTRAMMELLDHYETILQGMQERLNDPSKNNVPNSENQRNYFSQLLHQRYARVKYSVYPSFKVADSTLYHDFNGTNDTTDISQLHVLRCYSLENKRNMKEVMNTHGHWFIDNNYNCNYDKVVKAEKSVWNLKTN
ncbi:hypothetical protein FSP39_003124 [Pinctada imbricata]|uniref:Uncharacterized protein n=1 Tax=Pinctada imbricata TaxID=66713 RepID=A0AA88XHK8_PINIB|nr:hypothetical protein FSP39_003124 [Pinctada imbricata]